MVRANNEVWLHRLAWALALSTLFLVALGGVVTTKGVGMAVPDWPTTYGYHMFFFPFSKWMAGIFDEHSHRVWASIVGIFSAFLAIVAWARGTVGRQRWLGIVAILAGVGLVGVRQPVVFVVVAGLCVVVIALAIPRARQAAIRLRWLAVIAFAAVIIQGVFGGLRVILDAHGWGTEFGILHALLAQVFFVFVCSLVFITSRWWFREQPSELKAADGIRLRNVFLATTLLILVQLIFGATMRHLHQGLAVPDFPLAYGKLWPATDAAAVAHYNAYRLEAGGEQPITAFHIVMHMLHRYTGMLAWLAIGACLVMAWRSTTPGSILRKMALLWMTIATIQVALGIFTILSQRKVDVTTAHVAVGALTFMLGWISVLATARLSGVRTVTAEETDSMIASGRFKPA